MIQDFLGVFAMIGMGLLMVVKGDDQMIHILEGKLYHAGKNQKMASKVYRKHTNPLSMALFAGGLGVLGFVVMGLARENSVALSPVAIGLVLISGGIWGRIRSFVAADRELGC